MSQLEGPRSGRAIRRPIPADLGRRTAVYRWSLPELAGYVRSTSFLPVPVLADQGAAFDADLASTIGPFAGNGTVHQAVGFACELARRAATG